MSDDAKASGMEARNAERALSLAKLMNLLASAVCSGGAGPLQLERALFSSITTISVVFRGKPVHLLCRLHPGKPLEIIFAGSDAAANRELIRILEGDAVADRVPAAQDRDPS